MQKAIIGILLGIISIFPPHYFMWYQDFKPIGWLVLTLLASLVCAVTGLIYGAIEVKTKNKILAIIAIIICSISLLNFLFVLQCWFIVGGITDFMDYLRLH
jgi:hypothetical protein